MSDKSFGCGEVRRARVRTRRSVDGDFRMRLEDEMRGEAGDFRRLGKGSLGILWRQEVSEEVRSLAGVTADGDGVRWVDCVFTKMGITGLEREGTVVELRGRGEEERGVHGKVEEGKPDQMNGVHVEVHGGIKL